MFNYQLQICHLLESSYYYYGRQEDTGVHILKETLFSSIHRLGFFESSFVMLWYISNNYETFRLHDNLTLLVRAFKSSAVFADFMHNSGQNFSVLHLL